MSDDSLPSGNGIAALALNRLGHVLGDERYLSCGDKYDQGQLEFAAGISHTVIQRWSRHSMSISIHPKWLSSGGKRRTCRDWCDALNVRYAPRQLTFAIPDAERRPA